MSHQDSGCDACQSTNLATPITGSQHCDQCSLVDIVRPFERVELKVGALVVGADLYFDSHLDKFAALAARFAMPTIHALHEFVTSGGLMSYGADLADAHRLAGMHTGRILKGEKPADLPVQQSTKVKLTVNLKTVKTLGLTVPQSVLAAANEVIE